MKRIGKLRKFFMILLSLVMFTSPVFVSGCFGDYGGNSNTNKDDTNFTVITGGGGGDSGNNDSEQEQSKYPKENELSEDDYSNYFKNYRVTYKPSSTNRADYDASIREQNDAVASQVETRLILAGIDSNRLFSYDLPYIQVIISSGLNYISHKTTSDPVIIGISEEYNSYFDQSMEYLPFDEHTFKLAEALILSGHYLTSEDSSQNTFATEYNRYKDSSNIEEITNTFISQVNHLGYTDIEIEQLTEYLLKYVVGEEKLEEDNELFYNAYFDGDQIKEVTDSKYSKRYLTDQTYFTDLTGYGYNDRLEGLMYYAGEYLKQGSIQGNFSLNNVRIPVGYLADYYNELTDEDLSTVYNDYGLTEGVYNKLIKTDYRNSFNANVWEYDQDGDGIADDVVKYKVGSQEYALFSVRKPGFKNYYNTIYFMVRDLLKAKVTDANREELDEQWRQDHPFWTGGYPYSEVFPSVPFSYFDDFSSSSMLIDEETAEITMKGSAYQSYQSFMVMPEQDVYLESAGIIFMGPLGYDTEEIEMNLTVYIRYYDAETQSFAMWNQDGEVSEFYKVGDYVIPINNPDDPYILVDEDDATLDDILSSAMINGEEKGDCFLPAFPENEEVLTELGATLITKNNYGYWFNYVSTPEGKQVVCFDGRAANSQSYLEYVFYTDSDLPFMFSFFPAVAYSA